MLFFTILFTLLFWVSGASSPCNSPVEFICKTPDPSPDYYVPGNAVELKAYCLSTRNFVDCLNSYDLACVGRSHFRGIYPPFYYDRLKNFLENICDEKSSDHNALVRNLPCIKKRIEEMDEICERPRRKALSAYNEYVVQNPNSNIKGAFSRNLRDRCLSDVVTTDCVIRSIEEDCGFSAYEVAKKVMLETQILAEKCDVDIFLELKDAVDGLNLDRNIKEGLKTYFVVEIRD